MIFRTLISACIFMPVVLLGKSYFPKIDDPFCSSELSILITSPSMLDLYSDCTNPEAVVCIKHPASTPLTVTVTVELPPLIYLSSKDWLKTSNGIWSKKLVLPVSGELKIPLPLDITNKSAIATAKIKVTVTTHEEQAVHTEETSLSSRSATDLSSSQKTVSATQLIERKILTPILNDCGLGAYYLSGEVIIDQDVDFGQSASQFVVAPDTRIVVKNGTTLTLSNAIFSSCGTWSGIYVEPQGKLVLKNTLIKDTDSPVKYLDAPFVSKFQAPVMLSVFPNPTANNTTVRIDGQKLDDHFSVLVEDEQGKTHTVAHHVVNSGTEVNLEMGHLPNGYYLVNIRLSSGSTHTTKVLVEHK
jgi:hypothetical protein